jgi:sirohydrochlorin cobaltochelatase
VAFRYGSPLGAQYALVQALTANIADALAGDGSDIPLDRTAIVVAGRGSRDPDSNSEAAKVARLVWEGREYGWVELAFHSLTRPAVGDQVERVVRLGARRVILAPYLLFGGRIADRIAGAAGDACQRLGVPLAIAAPLGGHPCVLDALAHELDRVTNGAPAVNCDLCKYRRQFAAFEHEVGQPQSSDHHHGLRGIDAIIPPRYRGDATVSAAPMDAGELVYDGEGRVAWDRVWGSTDPDSPFCELALAGGPPHRGELLEPADPADVAADPPGYERVVAELARGIAITTGLTARPAASRGWIGVACASEEMALWLLRAILVENVSVRRERTTLFLPAGPSFRVEHEIRNVITALAKTHHYWKEHQLAQ